MPVVNIAHTPCDIYVGRRMNIAEHYGNPFSHKANTQGLVKVESRDEAVACFELWITGEAFEEVEPHRRKWILENLSVLRGKKLGCYCAPAKCHGEVLERLAEQL